MGDSLFEDKEKGNRFSKLESKGNNTYYLDVEFQDIGIITECAFKGFSEFLQREAVKDMDYLIVGLEKVSRIVSIDIPEIIAGYCLLENRGVDLYICGNGKKAKNLDRAGIRQTGIKLYGSIEEVFKDISRKPKKDKNRLKNIGNGIYVAHLEDTDFSGMDEYVLKGLADQVEKVSEDARYIILDFEKAKRFRSADATEITTYHRLFEESNIKIYLCNLGLEDQAPYKFIKMMGISELDYVEIRGTLEETLAELSQ